MKAIIWYSHFGDKFKCGIHFILCSLYRVVFFIPLENMSAFPKRIRPIIYKRMPIRTCKFEKVFHGLSCNFFIFIIPAKSQGVIAFKAFIFDLGNFLKKFFFS